MAFSLHAHLCAEHTAAIASASVKLREPPLGSKHPGPNLEIFFDEFFAVPPPKNSSSDLREGSSCAQNRLEHLCAPTISPTNPRRFALRPA